MLEILEASHSNPNVQQTRGMANAIPLLFFMHASTSVAENQAVVFRARLQGKRRDRLRHAFCLFYVL